MSEPLERIHLRIDETLQKVNDTNLSIIELKTNFRTTDVKIDNFIKKIDQDIYSPDKGMVTRIATVTNQTKTQWWLISLIVASIITLGMSLWTRK